MQPIKSFSTLFATLVMLGVILAPAAVPIIIPRAITRTIFDCQSQATGMTSVMDGHGHTYTLACATDLATRMGYPRLYPTEDVPWLVIITARSGRSGLAMPCFFMVTRAPVHLQCAANRDRQLTVDFDLILTMDFGSW